MFALAVVHPTAFCGAVLNGLRHNFDKVYQIYAVKYRQVPPLKAVRFFLVDIFQFDQNRPMENYTKSLSKIELKKLMLMALLELMVLSCICEKKSGPDVRIVIANSFKNFHFTRENFVIVQILAVNTFFLLNGKFPDLTQKITFNKHLEFLAKKSNHSVKISFLKECANKTILQLEETAAEDIRSEGFTSAGLKRIEEAVEQLKEALHILPDIEMENNWNSVNRVIFAMESLEKVLKGSEFASLVIENLAQFNEKYGRAFAQINRVFFDIYWGEYLLLKKGKDLGKGEVSAEVRPFFEKPYLDWNRQKLYEYARLIKVDQKILENQLQESN